MWLFTKFGFFSAVCARQGDGKLGKKVDKDRMMIRARDRGHLVALQAAFPDLADADIHESPHNDYRFRLFCPKPIWAVVVGKLVTDVDYDNFKSATAAWQGKQGKEYKDALTSVWSAMYHYQSKRHGPGIYDQPMDDADDLFTEDPVTFEQEIDWPEPGVDDDVILVLDSESESDESNILGVILWPDRFSSHEEAYATAVQAGVLRLVGNPTFQIVPWSNARSSELTCFDVDAHDVPASDEVI